MTSLATERNPQNMSSLEVSPLEKFRLNTEVASLSARLSGINPPEIYRSLSSTEVRHENGLEFIHMESDTHNSRITLAHTNPHNNVDLRHSNNSPWWSRDYQISTSDPRNGAVSHTTLTATLDHLIDTQGRNPLLDTVDLTGATVFDHYFTQLQRRAKKVRHIQRFATISCISPDFLTPDQAIAPCDIALVHRSEKGKKPTVALSASALLRIGDHTVRQSFSFHQTGRQNDKSMSFGAKAHLGSDTMPQEALDTYMKGIQDEPDCVVVPLIRAVKALQETYLQN